MSSSEEARSAWVAALADFQDALEEGQGEWQKDAMELGITLADMATPPELKSMLSEADRKVIEEVQSGKNSGI